MTHKKYSMTNHQKIKEVPNGKMVTGLFIEPWENIKNVNFLVKVDIENLTFRFNPSEGEPLYQTIHYAKNKIIFQNLVPDCQEHSGHRWRGNFWTRQWNPSRPQIYFWWSHCYHAHTAEHPFGNLSKQSPRGRHFTQ